MRKWIFIGLSMLVCLLITSHSYAGDPTINIKDGKIKGVIIDSNSNEPVEYATIALYKKSNDELITGTITNFTGHFKIENVEAGIYYLKVSFIGYQDIISNEFQIGPDNWTVNLGDMFIKSLSKELEEFEVVGKKAAIEYRIDKKVINVDKQITAEAGTAVDILENVPSVQVDVEGNVSLRGSSGFTVLIDGKPTILDPSDVLRQIPSSSIESIEIITNPSVKYDPDGATGIINIITKKNPLEGISGIANANLGMYGQYGGDFQLSYRVNKVNFVLGANYNKRPRPGFTTTNRVSITNDTSSFVDSYGETERARLMGSVKAGIEYNPSKNDFISIAGRYGVFDMNNNSTLLYTDWTIPETDFLTYNSIDETIREGDFYSFDGIYQHNFTKKKDPNNKRPENMNKGPNGGKERGSGERKGYKPSVIHSLKLEANYRYRNIDESTTNELRDLSDALLGGKKNVEKGPSESIRFNIDYTLPVNKKDKLEAGLRVRSGKSTDITELWLYDAATDVIDFVDEFSNETQYYRNIYSGYALYAGFLKKFGYQVGMRVEYTDRKIEITSEEPFILDRWDYFPTIHMSYNLEKDQQVMASYSRRIDRPRSWWLEPFVTWQDAYNVRQGNPNLKPEYIDSYDFGYIKNFGDNFLSLEGYYRVTHNKVERVSSVYTDNVLLTRPENVGQDFSLGIEAMLSLTVTKWWDMDISANLFNYKLDGELTYIQEDQTIVEPLYRTSTNWNSRFNNTFHLWKNGVLQLNSRYNSASVTAQGTSSGYYTLDAAFKVSFLDRSLSLNLQGRNLLGTAIRERTSEGLGFSSYYKYEPRSPAIVLTISYRFNNFKQSRRSGQNGDNEDEF